LLTGFGPSALVFTDLRLRLGVRLAAPEGFSSGRAAPARTKTRGRWQPISGLLVSISACDLTIVRSDYATHYTTGQLISATKCILHLGFLPQGHYNLML
jgi:hypothetical protein